MPEDLAIGVSPSHLTELCPDGDIADAALTIGASPEMLEAEAEEVRAREIADRVLEHVVRAGGKCLKSTREGRLVTVLIKVSYEGDEDPEPDDVEIMRRLFVIATRDRFKPVLVFDTCSPEHYDPSSPRTPDYCAVLLRWGSAATAEGLYESENYYWRKVKEGERRPWMEGMMPPVTDEPAATI